MVFRNLSVTENIKERKKERKKERMTKYITKERIQAELFLKWKGKGNRALYEIQA